MSNHSKIFESVLYKVWREQNFTSKLQTIEGDEIEVLDTGSHNDDLGGPDFKNTRIRIGNLTFVGDLEIDLNYSDWKSHGHNIDNKYNSVILHLCLANSYQNGYVYARNGRKIPSISIEENIDSKLVENLSVGEPARHKSNLQEKLKCTDLNSKIDNTEKVEFLKKLGAERFGKKCDKIYDRLKELQFLHDENIKEPVIGYDLSAKFQEKEFKKSDFSSKKIWMQLFYELLFEALGYSKNKSQMLSLAQNAPINFLSRIENDGVLVEKLEAVLFNISGLVQSKQCVKEKDTIEYLDRIQLLWNSVFPVYDGKMLDETIWHFFRLRPQNFPTIRIAAGARLLKELIYGELIETIAKKIDEIHNLKVLINSLRTLFVIKSGGFWRNHFIFDQLSHSDLKYFVGAARADEIVVNVLLPFFSVYFEVFKQPKNVTKILKIFSMYEQRSENQIVVDVATALGQSENIKYAMLSQGMIDLFRNFCSKNKCLECEIGKKVFD